MKQICYSIIIISFACHLLFFGCSKSGRRAVVNKQDKEILVGKDAPKSIENKPPVNIPESTPTLEPNQSSANSPATGTNLIKPRGPIGRGTLKVINGTDRDAVVKLAEESSKKTRRLFFVRANSEFKIEGIGMCKCILQFSMGTDWEKSKRKFLRDKSFSQFDDLLEFRETKTNLGIEWATFEVTLHSIQDGNAHTTPIDESDFETDE